MGSWPRLGAFLCFAPLAMLASVCAAASGERVHAVQPPLSFEVNEGQAPRDVRFVLHNGASAAGFRGDGFELVLPGGKGQPAQSLSIVFAGARQAAIAGEEPTGGKTSYLIGRDTTRWVRNVPHYGAVRYGGVYPGVDVRFYGHGSALEHDFEVRAGADPGEIGLRIEGAEKIAISEAGDLTLSLPEGQIALRKPEAYQTIGGRRRPVEARFVRARDGTVRFAVGQYDRGHALVIDPVLVCATYLAALPSVPVAVATDAAGNTYAAGWTEIFPFPTTAGSFMPNCSDCSEMVYVTKLNAGGTAEVFSTLLGGNEMSQATSIAVDPSGNVVVGGLTYAWDFPTKNPVVAPPPPSPLPSLEFVTSLTPDGSALNDSTVVDGQGTISVATDAEGNVYFAGSADEKYPVTAGAVNTPGANEFATKITATGQLVWSAMLGQVEPTDDDEQAIAVDGQGSLYLLGDALSWPTTAGAYLTQQPADDSIPSGDTAFVSKLSPDGTRFVYSTWIAAAQHVVGLALDSADDVWFAVDGAADYPVTANAFNSYMPNGAYAYSELSADGSQLLYSSFFAEGVPDSPSAITGIGVDPSNDIWLVGTTDDPGFPLKNPVANGSSGGFVTEFSPGGTAIAFSTYFSAVAAIALDPGGKAHTLGNEFGYTSPGAFLSTAQWLPNQYTLHSYAAVLDASVAAPSLCVQYGVAGVVELTNCGNATLNVESVTTTESNFTVTSNNCTTVPEGDSCSIDTSYVATPGSSCFAALEINSNASVPAMLIGISAPSFSCTPSLEFAPVGLAFGSQATGTTSAPQTITLTNTAHGAVTFSSITGTAEFPETNTCGTSLALGASCTVSVSFAPLADGPRTGTLAIAGDLGPNPQTIPLSGTGTGPTPGVTLSPAALSFSMASLGQTSAPQTVTLTNSGQGALSIASIAVSNVQDGNQSQFAETDNCPALLAAGASCSMSVTFSTARGLFSSGTLSVTDNAVNSPQQVLLLGNEEGMTISATPSTLTMSAAAGSIATATIDLTAYGGATGSAGLSCSVAWAGSATITPVYPTCLVPVEGIPISGGVATAPLTMEAAPSTASNQEWRLWRTASVWAAAVCAGLGLRRRRCPMLLVVVLLLAVGGISACGGGGASSSGGGGIGGGSGSTSTTTPGNYIVTVSLVDGTGPGSTTTVALTVQ